MCGKPREPTGVGPLVLICCAQFCLETRFTFPFIYPLPFMTLRRSGFLLAIFFTAALLLGGCSNFGNTKKGAVIGNAAGGTAEGAIIGAVVGGTAGAIIGSRMDTKAEELDEELENAEVERVGEGIKITFDSGILFKFDSAEIQGQAEEHLTKLANTMEDFDGSNLLIVGHTDAKGTVEYNQTLSEERSGSAGNFLIRQGFSSGRIQTLGKGESEPVSSNETEEGMQQNRRVEVAIYASEEYREQVQKRSSESSSSE